MITENIYKEFKSDYKISNYIQFLGTLLTILFLIPIFVLLYYLYKDFSLVKLILNSMENYPIPWGLSVMVYSALIVFSFFIAGYDYMNKLIPSYKLEVKEDLKALKEISRDSYMSGFDEIIEMSDDKIFEFYKKTVLEDEFPKYLKELTIDNLISDFEYYKKRYDNEEDNFNRKLLFYKCLDIANKVEKFGYKLY